MTGGRTRTRHHLSVDTILQPRAGRPGPMGRPEEYQQVLDLCRQQRRTIAELAGTLHRPVTAVTVVVADLLDAKELTVYVDTAFENDRATPQLIQALVASLRREWPDAQNHLRHAG
ncbi:DUF742 domain-containing protein [Streptomyces sp. DT195]|uniref:DUF742 domain-containing protein n=1 Tax=Streptomyces sp. DT195 TaxID=3393419 RepID=UPI003CF555F3